MKTYEEIAKNSRIAVSELKTLNCDGTLDNSDLVRESIIYHELVAEACEKQVAKKPIKGTICMSKRIAKQGLKELEYCPTCGEYLKDTIGNLHMHCSDCGQAIDWSEVDE